jgi:hypothetical protein
MFAIVLSCDLLFQQNPRQIKPGALIIALARVAN